MSDLKTAGVGLVVAALLAVSPGTGPLLTASAWAGPLGGGLEGGLAGHGSGHLGGLTPGHGLHGHRLGGVRESLHSTRHVLEDAKHGDRIPEIQAPTNPAPSGDGSTDDDAGPDPVIPADRPELMPPDAPPAEASHRGKSDVHTGTGPGEASASTSHKVKAEAGSADQDEGDAAEASGS